MFNFGAACPGLKRDGRKITVCAVYLSLLLDNMLLTMIVPIMPDFLIEHHRLEIEGISNKREYQRSYLSSVLAAPVPANGSGSMNYESSVNAPFDLENENGRVGFLLSSKALVQLLLNPMVGSITTRLGYPLPLFLGTCTLLISAMMFAFGTDYVTFLLARSLQGVASSCIGITGMCLVAEKYPNEPDRSKMMGFVLGSVGIGVLVGYPFGGFLYDCLGKTAPFLIIVLFICLNGALQLCSSDLKPSEEKLLPYVGWLQLLRDKRILLTGGAIGISTSTIAMLEPCLPIWLLQEIKPEKWQLGTAFVPDSLGYFIGTNSVALVAYEMERSKIALPAMILVGISASLVPMAATMLQLVVPHFLLGFGIGAVDAALVPLLAAFVDMKYSTHYGTVYAMQQMSVSLAYFLGPVLGSGMAKALGFPWMMRIIGLTNILYSPVLLLLGRIIDGNCSEDERKIIDCRRSGSTNYRVFPDPKRSS